MADSRIKDLSGEILSNEISALLSTLYMVADDPSFSDAKKIKLASILQSGIIGESTNNYQAMTPQSFYNSVATESRKGIVELASAAEVAAKSASTVLTCSKIAEIEAIIASDWFNNDGVPVVYFKGADALCFSTTVFSQTFNNGDYIILSPNLAGKKIYNCTVAVSYGANENNSVKYLSFGSSGGQQDQDINSMCKIQITPGRTQLRIVANTDFTRFRAAVNVTMTLYS